MSFSQITANMKSAVSAQQSTTQNNMLISISENVEEILFHKNSTDSKDTLKQDNLQYRLSNLYLTQKFIYLTYTTNENAKFTNKNQFIITPTQQGYILDKTSGKLFSIEEAVKPYSTDKIPATGFSRVFENGIVEINEKYYILSVEDSKLVIKEFINNPDIKIYSIDISNNGTIFVGNNNISQEYGDYYYYRKLSNDCYGLGSDGNFYCFNQNTLKVFNNNNELVSAENNIQTLITIYKELSGISYKLLVNNNYIFEINDSQVTVFDFYNPGNLKFIDATNVTILNNKIIAINKDYKLCEYNLNGDSIEEVMTEKILLYKGEQISPTSLFALNDKIIINKEQVNKSELYNLTYEDDTAKISYVTTDLFSGTGKLQTVFALN